MDKARACGTINEVTADGAYQQLARPRLVARRLHGMRGARLASRAVGVVALVVGIVIAGAHASTTAAQAPAPTPWPVVTAPVAPPPVPGNPVPGRPDPTVEPLPPVDDGDPADGIARSRSSRVGYVVVAILGVTGIALYGWSARRRLSGRD